MARVFTRIRLPHAAIRFAAAVIAAGCSTLGPLDTGSLSILVNDPPSGPAAITVSGPSGFHKTVTATTTLSGLAPGTYTIASPKVVVSGTTFAVPSFTAVVVASEIPTSVSAAYAQVLNITSGNPSPGKVGVTYDQVVTQTVLDWCTSGSLSSCAPCTGGGDRPTCESPRGCVLSGRSPNSTITNPPCLLFRTNVVTQPFVLSGNGGLPPYSWSASPIPGGLTFDASSGALTGTPTTAGSYSVVVTMVDSATPPDSATAIYTIVIAP